MRWTLRRKILGGYGLVLLLLALVLGWAFTNLLRLGSASEAILSENYQSIRAADDMIGALERQDSGVLLHLLGYREKGLRQYRTFQTTFAENLGQARGNITIGGERQVVARIDSAYEHFLRETEVVSNSVTPSDSTYRNRMLPAFLNVRRAVERLRRLNQETMVTASDRAENVATRAVWSVGGVGVGALLLGFVLSFVLSNRLVRPIRRLREAAGRIAEGDYDVTVPVARSDELGRLADQFNEMAEQLRAFEALNLERIVAEQRKSEAIMQNIDDGLLAVGTGFELLNMNAAAAHILEADAEPGRDRGVRGRHFLEVIDNRHLFSYLEETAKTGRPPEVEPEEEFLTVARDGRERHYQVGVTPFRNAAGDMLGVVLLLRDVTRLRELDRLKSEFVATASHELKTPLTSIGMSMGLLEERLTSILDEGNRELLEAANEEVGRLRTLVEDLLDLSKIEGGRMEMQQYPTALKDLTDHTHRNFRPQADEQGVKLQSDVPEDLPDVQADPEKIVQVLTNLVANALRFTEEGDFIRISARPEGEEIHVAVVDSGPGIPREEQKRIFGKFTQIENGDAVGGTGLGLAICREIVRQHGGRIWVDSTPGEGATFAFTLPLAREEA